MVRVVLLAFLVALFSMSCSQGSVGKSSELSPEGMLEQAHRALLELEYCKFALSHSGDGTELFPGVTLSSIEGYLEFPDKSEFLVSAQLGSMLLETSVVMGNERAFMTDFFSGQWQEIPSDSLPIDVLYFREALSAILVSLDEVELQSDSTEESDLVTINGTTNSSVLSDLLSGALPDDTVDAKVVLQKHTHMLSQITLTGKLVDTDGLDMVRTLTLDYIDMPLIIAGPTINN